MDDPYRLQRFLEAQEPCFGAVRAELAAGRKQSHWMWFVFPQLQGLGSSPTARHYAIASLAEARAYLTHPLLGARLRECTALINGLEGTTAEAVFGYPDYVKFRSCMTLFAHASGEASHAGSAGQLFVAALAKYFAGEEDPLTRELLRASRTSG
jgi:uncharacterized protein (DUF1810 family)